KTVQQNALNTGLLDPYVMGTKTDALIYQVPGGMLSNLIAQLKAQNAMDKFDDALAEIPKVRADLGFPPLVTPTSQITGVQAVMNVMTGERYKMISKEVKAYVRGEYGKAPGKVSPELIKIVMKDEKPMTGRFADSLKPQFEAAKAEIGKLARNDEDVLSYIAFPQLAENFFKIRENPSLAPKDSPNTVKYSIRRA
ncbi:MAG: oxaloacetate decarboxylase subunit alpha, partial [Oscillospiraceae bacterium]